MFETRLDILFDVTSIKAHLCLTKCFCPNLFKQIVTILQRSCEITFNKSLEFDCKNILPNLSVFLHKAHGEEDVVVHEKCYTAGTDSSFVDNNAEGCKCKVRYKVLQADLKNG